MARKRKNEEESGFSGTGESRSRLTPVDIQQKVFRLSFRGYNERDVDEFLDHVTEDLAALHEENKRLREQLAEGGGGAEANRQAEAIVRQAREHAARLIEEAERAGRDSAGGSVPASFLLKERDFLQTLAQTVQDHAKWLKEEAGRPTRASAAVAQAPAPTGGGQTAAVASPPTPAAVPPQRGPATAAPEAQAAAAATMASTATVEDEPTAAWSAEAGAQEGVAEGGQSDPLISAWESAFTSEEGGEAPARRPGAEGEPSLRELFWGEE